MNKLSQKFHGLKILFKFDNTAQLLINRLFFPNNGPTMYLLNDLEVLVDHSSGDQDGTRSCLVPGLYDPCFEALADLPKSLSVLDLGANGGGFFLALKNRGHEIRKAVAVELNPHTHSRLRLNLLRNIPACHQRIAILNGAAGGIDGELKVKLGRGSVGDSMSGSSAGGEEFRLPSYSFGTLSRYFPDTEDIDLCKIDIEGAEYALIKSTSPEMIRKCRHIIIELHDMDGERQEQLIQRIISMGFKKIEPHRPLPETTVYFFTRES